MSVIARRSTTFRCILLTAAIIVIFNHILVAPMNALQINEQNNSKRYPINTFQKVKRLSDESSLDPVSNADDETQRSVRKSAVLYNKAETTTTTQSNIVASLFRLNEEEGNTCILLRVDAVIEVKFKTKLGSEDVRVRNKLFKYQFVFIIILFYGYYVSYSKLISMFLTTQK